MNNNELPKRTGMQKIFSLIIVILIIFAGVSLSKYFIKTKPKAKRKPPATTEIAVRVIKPKKTDDVVKISAIGTVIPSETLALKPRVSGTITYINPKLIPGGFLKKGETAVRIDKQDYLLIRNIKASNLEKAKSDLEIEYGKQKVAKNEWKLLRQYMKNVDNSSANLALRKPQLKQKLATMKIAEQELRQAELNLKRTSVKIPFDSVVTEKNVNHGSVVNTQTVLAKLNGTGSFWIETSIPGEYLKFLNLSFSQQKFDNKVRIYELNMQNDKYINGEIIKLLSSVDPKGKMAKLLIEVKDPLNLKCVKNKFPLLSGNTVKVVIEGIKFNNIYSLPTNLIYEGNYVLTVKNDKLKKTPVDIVWKDVKNSFIRKGLNDNDSIIVTNISAPVDGMKVKVIK